MGDGRVARSRGVVKAHCGLPCVLTFTFKQAAGLVPGDMFINAGRVPLR